MEKINEQLLFDVGKEAFRNSLENNEFERVKENKDYYIESHADELPYVVERFQDYLNEHKSNTLGIVVTSLECRTFKISVVELKNQKNEK